MHNYYLENKQTIKEKFNRRCQFHKLEKENFQCVH